MYSGASAWDWNELSQLAYRADQERLGSRFPIELRDDLILSPQLYGWRDAKPFLSRGVRGHRGRSEYFTLTERPEFVLYVARTEAHVAHLERELGPALAGQTMLVVVDPKARTFRALGEHEGGLDELAAFLGRQLGDESILPKESFEKLEAPWNAPILQPSFFTPKENVVSVIERAPIRLWEAFLWRGYVNRWELVDGEVPLAGRLPTDLAANRALLSCVRDAETWTAQRATERDGWIVVGSFRLRQRETMLEIRVRLTPADTRVGFMPVAERAGASDVPTLAGVLTAGGDNGKTEWIHGYNWSTVECEVEGESERLARSLRRELLALGASRVDVVRFDESEFPRHTDGRWVIRHDDEVLSLYMPLMRDDDAPVFSLHGVGAEEREIPFATFRIWQKMSAADVEGVRANVRAALGAGKVVWVVRDDAKCVEIWEPSMTEPRHAHRGERIDVPGVLAHPVAVEALLR